MHPDTHRTLNGALCIPTGRIFTAQGDRTEKAEAGDYIECQMLPLDTFRLERIKRVNVHLHPDLRKGVKRA
jgi:hypothetical protein